LLAPISALLLLLAGIISGGLNNAHAATGVTLYVGQTQGVNTSCSSPGFTSVQAAVDVANNGDTVYLCGTTPYAEQVVIQQKAITLTGDTGATIQAPDPFPATSPTRLPPQFTTDNLLVPQAIVFVWGSSANVKIKGLTITGPLPGNGGCAENEFGVLVIDNATATLNKDQVTNIHDKNASLYGCQFGVGVQIGREYWPSANSGGFVTEDFVGYATIKGTTVSGYQKNGITIDGPGSKATVTTSTVNGAGQSDTVFSPIIAQNGIQISRGAKGQITYNTVTGNAYTGGGGASSGGILVYGGSCDGPSTPLTINVNVSHNILQNNDVGVFVSNLIVDQSGNYCVLPTSKTGILARYNTVSNGAATNVSGSNLLGAPGGYQAGVSDEGYADQIVGNSICGVGYTPVTTPPPYLSHIDVVATNPTISGNTTCSNSQSNSVSAWSQTGKVLKLHYRMKAVK